MKPGIVFTLISAALLFIFSCEKEDANSDDQAIRIDTKTNYYDGLLSGYYTYRYDEYDRVIERSAVVDYSIGINTEKIIYGDDINIIYHYYAETDTPEVTFDYLNTKGLVDSSVSYFNNEITSRISYKYDNDGYLIKRDFKSEDNKMSFYDSFEIENGNRKKCIYQMVFGAPDNDIPIYPSIVAASVTFSLKEKLFLQKRLENKNLKSLTTQTIYNDTVYYEYNNKANTTSDSNEGYAWQGLPNKNLSIKATIKSDNGTSYENYVYDYDEKGRVIKQYYTDNNSNWTTYTYVK
jgi:hypothetical protein